MDTKKTIIDQDSDILKQCDISVSTMHYILHNLFRGLKPIRNKYKLSINEIIFLNGMYLYCKHMSLTVSRNACLKFIGYYNLRKIKYYLESLMSKGMIQMAQKIKGYNHYKITPLGFEVMNNINGSFNSCLYEWFQRYNISL